MRADVAIIGAGPSGGMAACRLAPTGLKVVILEKETLPRHKPCGGGLSGSVKRTLDWDLTPLVENEVTVRKNLYNFAQPKVVTARSFLMVNRGRFDARLIEQAVSSGKGTVALRDGFRVTHVEETTDSVLIRGENGERIEVDFLIAADGAFSRIGRCLGLNRESSHGVAIDAEVEVSPEVYEAERQVATFNFFCLPYGYGWIFPKRDGLLSCGVCAWHGRSSLRKEMNDFLSKSFPPGSIRTVKTFSHPIPLYSGYREIATWRVCLVGDAASLVDPITGEGIRFALESGALAAEVIIGLVGVKPDTETDRPIPARGWGDCRVYQSLIHEGIGRDLENLHRFVQPIFLDAPEFFYRKFILEGLNYDHLARELAERLGKTEVQGA